MGRIVDRLKSIVHNWNAFLNEDKAAGFRSYDGNMGYGRRPDRSRMSFSGERSIIASIYTRLAIDTTMYEIKHVRQDEDERYLENIKSGLSECLNVQPNLDQGPSQFRQDIVMTLLEEGTAAIVPVDTTLDPSTSGGFDIKTLRVGRIVGWFPYHVRVSLYNEAKGRNEEIMLEKKFVAIVENPLYAVMNENITTLKRLITKLNLLDAVDVASSSGKLDLIIQLPYVVKSETKRNTAEQRRKDIEAQLVGSKYGIAYTDGTERITQLNRPAENQLLDQIKYLTDLLYTQLGLTPEVMNGTADEATMLNYNNRTIKPIVVAIVEAMKRSFLTKTARAQHQSIMAFRDPLAYVPMATLAEIADKFTRNEIASSNDIRVAIGWKPSKDPKANKLVNSNMPQPEAAPAEAAAAEEDTAVDDMLAELDSGFDDIFASLGVDENAFA